MDVIVKMNLEVLFANEGQVEETLNTAQVGIVGPGRDPYFNLASRLMMTFATEIQHQTDYNLKPGDRLILSIPQNQEAVMITDPVTVFDPLLSFPKTQRG